MNLNHKLLSKKENVKLSIQFKDKDHAEFIARKDDFIFRAKVYFIGDRFTLTPMLVPAFVKDAYFEGEIERAKYWNDRGESLNTVSDLF